MLKRTILVLTIGLLTACSQDTEEQPELSTEPIEVDVLNEASASVGDDVTFQIEVTQAGDGVEDANEVIIEVWTDGEKENSAMVPAEHTENGVYTADFTYAEPALYYVQPHVTARGMHSMPVHEVDVSDN
ncbi:FixH family protein [Geomicrobium sp. JCM 19039]|uniref:FixH family protein n=1 Tax=Geomicrobium sp. JCM 19039 TaxID=1460636 RepID=UPI00045F24B9|nr:FixH family protein [Geomicrobium sp. JCM 19039]GAK13404.1 hypothetical protein JCM19039_3247 [Geomicrobium sp. JCM 19039]